MEVNVTIETNKDFFEGIYSHTWLNWLNLGIYLLGLVSCCGLALVSWFERSGLAGPYRTLLNQLVTFNVNMLIFHYVVGNGICTMRGIFGPLPQSVCGLAIYVKTFAGTNMGLTSLVRTCFKFAFIFKYRSIPVMEENLLATIICSSSFLLSLLATLAKYYVDSGELIQQLICDGHNSGWSHDDFQVKLGINVCIICFVIHLILSVPIMKERHWNFPVPYNHQGNASSTFENTLVSLTNELLIIIAAGLTLLVIWAEPEELNHFPMKLAVFAINTIFPFFFVTILFFVLLLTQRQFRKFLKTRMCKCLENLDNA